MGMWDEFCLVCGGPSYVFFDDELDSGKPQPKAADYAWLEALVGIAHTEEVIALGSDTGMGSFDPHPDEKKYTSFDIGCRQDQYDAAEAHGYACHVACYSLLQRELNHTLRFQDVRPLLVDAEWCALNKFAWSDYGGLSEYQDEGFLEAQLLEDGKLWMIEDPSVNLANAQRILALWRPLVHSGFRRPDSGDDASQRAGGDGVAAPAGDVRGESVGAANAAAVTDVQEEPTELTLKEKKANPPEDN